MINQLGSIQTSHPDILQFFGWLQANSLKAEAIHQAIVIVGAKGSGRRTLVQQIRSWGSFYANYQILHDQHEKAFTVQTFTLIDQENYTEALAIELKSEGALVFKMPDLFQRKQDLIELSRFYVGVFAVMNGVAGLALTEDAYDLVLDYNWPGQAIELESVIEKACAKAIQQGIKRVSAHHFDLPRATQEDLQFRIGMKLEDIERKFILQTLYFADNNRTRAAEILGISIRTLRNKINQYKQEGFL